MFLHVIMQVEEVRAYKEELMRQKKLMIEQKMQQAEEKRLTMLKSKALKAHDEEAKVSEWVTEVNDRAKDAAGRGEETYYAEVQGSESSWWRGKGEWVSDRS